MKGSLDFLCVPQLNKDTTYFSSIVEATSRVGLADEDIKKISQIYIVVYANLNLGHMAH